MDAKKTQVFECEQDTEKNRSVLESREEAGNENRQKQCNKY